MAKSSYTKSQNSKTYPMNSQGVIFSSDEGVCVYHNDETKYFSEFQWAPSLADITHDLAEYIHIDEASITGFLEDNQCFETCAYVYFKTNERFYKLSKEEYFSETLKSLIDGINQLQCVNGFVEMTSRQKACLEKVLSQILFLSTSIEQTIVLPIFAEIDYLNQSDYESDDIPWKIEISTSDPLWIEAFSKINFDVSQPVNLQYCYSYFCKCHLFKHIW